MEDLFIINEDVSLNSRDQEHFKNKQGILQNVDKQNEHQKPTNKNNQFETFRNNTSFYHFIKKWNEYVKEQYYKSDVKKIMTFYQYQTMMYFSGQYLNWEIINDLKLSQLPRGLLLFFTMGTGKTIAFIGAALKSLSYRIDIYDEQSKIYIIINKALQEKTVQEIEKYIKILNINQLDLNLEINQTQINYDDIISKFKFITYNDPQNLHKNIVSEFSSFKSLESKIIIFDECQNLFKSIMTQSSRGMSIYDQLINLRNIQLLFASGTPISNNVQELASCFQLLTGNKDIFKPQHFSDVFLQQSGFIKKQVTVRNKEIFLRRITGLVIYVEIDVQDESDDFPKLLPLQLCSVQMPPRMSILYQQEKKKETKDSFMQNTRMISNGVITTTHGKKEIISPKFQVIKQFIEINNDKLHIIFSNFVDNGCILFEQYCIGSDNQQYQWKSYQHLKSEKNSKSQIITSKKPIIIANINGKIDPHQRQQIIDIFNQKNNIDGRIINVLILSPASTEGINLQCVRFVHILEPQWSLTQFEQVVFRAVRRFSHKSLDKQDQTVQPILYISFDSNDYQLDELRNKQTDYSTDQQIYYKSLKKEFTIYQFLSMLQIAAVNCFDYKKITLKKIQKILNIDTIDEQQDPCYNCQATNKQLFNPINIYKDLEINNCIKITNSNQNTHQIIYNNIKYLWFYDIYSQYGMRFHEARDINKSYIEETTKLFQDLFLLVQQQLTILKQYDSEENTQNHDYNVSLKIRQLNIILNKQKKQKHSSITQSLSLNFNTLDIPTNPFLQSILPNNIYIPNDLILTKLKQIPQINDESISYSVQSFSKKTINQNFDQQIQISVQNAVSLLRFKKTYSNTIQYIIYHVQQDKQFDLITDFEHYYQKRKHKSYMWNGQVMPFQRFLTDFLIPEYGKQIMTKYAQQIQQLLQPIDKSQNIIINYTNEDDLQINLLKLVLIQLLDIYFQ